MITEESIYVKKEGSKTHILLCYVDDILVLSNDMTEVNMVKDKFRSWFSIHDKGEVKLFLGITIERDRNRRTIKLGQASYIDEVIQKFNLTEAYPTTTPMEPATS
jgi:hypothetical protein